MLSTLDFEDGLSLEVWFCGAGIVDYLGFHALICSSFSLSVPCFQDLVWFCWSPFCWQTFLGLEVQSFAVTLGMSIS